MTNVFSEQEEGVAENCCNLWIFISMRIGGGNQITHFSKAVIVMVLNSIVPGDTNRAVLVGPFQA